MRLAVAAAVLVLSGGSVSADWLVELDGGDHMRVDSYREDGDRLHLMRGDIDLSVPRSRVRAMKKISGADTQRVAPGIVAEHPAPKN
jgi:hypothetical protein